MMMKSVVWPVQMELLSLNKHKPYHVIPDVTLSLGEKNVVLQSMDAEYTVNPFLFLRILYVVIESLRYKVKNFYLNQRFKKQTYTSVVDVP